MNPTRLLFFSLRKENTAYYEIPTKGEAMLSERNIAEINNQIAAKLDRLGRLLTDDEATIKEIAQLKSLLYPQPSEDELLNGLALALVNQTRDIGVTGDRSLTFTINLR